MLKSKSNAPVAPDKVNVQILILKLNMLLRGQILKYVHSLNLASKAAIKYIKNKTAGWANHRFSQIRSLPRP